MAMEARLVCLEPGCQAMKCPICVCMHTGAKLDGDILDNCDLELTQLQWVEPTAVNEEIVEVSATNPKTAAALLRDLGLAFVDAVLHVSTAVLKGITPSLVHIKHPLWSQT